MLRQRLKDFFAHRHTRAMIRMTIGWIFIGLGIIGLFLPILQGILFLAVGVALLADHIPIFMKIKKYIYRRFPKLEMMVHREHEKIHRLGIRIKNGEFNSAFKWCGLTIAAVLSIIVPFMIFGERIDAWTKQLIEGSQHNAAVVGTILGGLLASDILLPIPSSIVSTACGVLLGLVAGTLVSLAGMVTSCVIGYFLAAKLGQPFVTKMVGEKSMKHFKELQRKHGNLVVVITRPVPVLAEIAVLSAGLGQIPFGRFLLLSTLSNLGISLVYAAIGAYSSNLNSFLIAVAGSMLLPGIGMLWMRARK